ncbi:hypothetical protein OROHE_005441 [Orobanche hederae]
MLSGTIPPIPGNLTYTLGFKLQHVERNHTADSWKFNIHSRCLHENRLSGSIPAKLGDMTKLHYLKLNGNLHIGNIPSELGKLIDMFDLNVASNHFEGPIPDNLSSCTNLNGLNLSYNDLKGPIPIELSGLVIWTIYLSNSRLSDHMPSSLGDLEHLLKRQLLEVASDG